MNITIIGIDCATDPKKTGMALASVEGKRTVLRELTTGKNGSPAEIAHRWIRNDRQVLLALDAPMGWPTELGRLLDRHEAGQELEKDSKSLFRRETDRFVAERIGKQPLDVGADRIARTAHSALNLLARLRNLTGSEIPLAWSPKLGQAIEAIEVYPAGTLTAHKLPNSGYKKSTDRKVREEIMTGIKQDLDIDRTFEDRLIGNPDLLDAAVCVLAAKEFLEWKVLPPEDLDLAGKEGWIWVGPPVKQ